MSSTSPPTNSKRRKVSRACDQCCRKKIKCDGEMPKCAACIRSQMNCSYTRELRKRGSKTGYIASFGARLDHLERLVASQSGSMQECQDLMVSGSDESLSQSSHQLSDQSFVPLSVFNADSTQPMLKSQCSTPESASTCPSPEQSLSLIDDTLLSFLADSPNLGTSESHTFTLPSEQIVSANHGTNGSEINWKLLDLYFNYVYPVAPVIPKLHFLRIAQNEPRILLYSMYAMAAKYENNCANAGHGYFRKAKAELVTEIANPSLSLIHSLFLMGYYAGFCDTPGFGSSVMALAIKSAFRLGLSNEESFDYERNGYSFFTRSQNTEVVRRLWWLLYVADVNERRFGDPFHLIREEDCQTCLPEHDDLIWTQGETERWIQPGSLEAKKRITQLSSPNVFCLFIPTKCRISLVIQLHKMDRRVIQLNRKSLDFAEPLPYQEAEYEMQQIDASLNGFFKGLDPCIGSAIHANYIAKDTLSNAQYWMDVYTHLLGRYIQFSLIRGRMTAIAKSQGLVESMQSPIATQLVNIVSLFPVMIAKMLGSPDSFSYMSPLITHILFEIGMMHVVGVKTSPTPEHSALSRRCVNQTVQALFKHGELVSYSLMFSQILPQLLDDKIVISDLSDPGSALKSHVFELMKGINNMKP